MLSPLNFIRVVFLGHDKFDKKIIECIADRLDSIDCKLERIERTMTTKSELQEAKDQLTKALGEITGEIGTLKEKVADLEAAAQNGEDVSGLISEVKELAQRLDDIVPDVTTTPGEDTITAPEGEDTLPASEGGEAVPVDGISVDSGTEGGNTVHSTDEATDTLASQDNTGEG